MDPLSFILTNLLNGLVGILLLICGYKLFDIATPKIDFYEELKKDSFPVTVLLTAFFICLSIIVCTTAN